VRKLFNAKLLNPLISSDKDGFTTLFMDYGRKVAVKERELEEQKAACSESKSLALELIQGLLGPEIGEQLVAPLEEAYRVVAERA
jgi:hypothetical protein